MNDVFTSSVDLPVGPDEAFALVTEPERLRRWAAVCATVDLRAGGSWSWMVTPGAAHIAGGTVREVEPGRRLVLGWGWQDDADLPPDASTVTVTIEGTEGGSRLTIEHAGLVGARAGRGTPRAGSTTSSGSSASPSRATPGPTSGPGRRRTSTRSSSGTPRWPRSSRCCAGSPRRTSPSRRRAPSSTCHQVAVHLMESISGLGAMAGATVEMPADGSLESKVSQMTDQTLRAWQDRGLEGTVTDPAGRDVPAAFGPAVLAIELLLHGWDLAQGSGQTMEVSDEVVAYVAAAGGADHPRRAWVRLR